MFLLVSSTHGQQVPITETTRQIRNTLSTKEHLKEPNETLDKVIEIITIGGSRIKDLMDTDEYHQGESKEFSLQRNILKQNHISNTEGGQQVPSLLKTEKIKSMTREIKTMKTTNDQPIR
jgi:hypothetical protein